VVGVVNLLLCSLLAKNDLLEEQMLFFLLHEYKSTINKLNELHISNNNISPKKNKKKLRAIIALIDASKNQLE
jgi:hypothetical protein